MRMFLSLGLVVCGVASAQLTPVPPPPTATPSHPFFITKTWVVGGVRRLGLHDHGSLGPPVVHRPRTQRAGSRRGIRRRRWSRQGTARGTCRRSRSRRILRIYQRWPGGHGAGLRPAQFSGGCEHSNGAVSAFHGPRSNQRAALCGGFSGDCDRKPNQRNARPASSRQTQPSRAVPPRVAAMGGPESTVTVIDTERRIPLGADRAFRKPWIRAG